jgi:hypothetical protein
MTLISRIQETKDPRSTPNTLNLKGHGPSCPKLCSDPASECHYSAAYSSLFLFASFRVFSEQFNPSKKGKTPVSVLAAARKRVVSSTELRDPQERFAPIHFSAMSTAAETSLAAK